MSESVDLVVVGGGSGGFAAALTGARLGLSVLLVEKADMLGGTAVRAGVNCWERGAGGTGVPFDLYKRLKQIPNAIGFYSFGRHGSWYVPGRDPFQFLGGEQVIDRSRRYIDSLREWGRPSGAAEAEQYQRTYWHGVPFEPAAMESTMRQMLSETGRCIVLLNTTFTKVEHRGGRVERLTLSDGRVVAAGAFVDSTGDVALCQALGCSLRVGQEPQSAFDEPSAPVSASDKVNGVTLIFRIAPKGKPGVDPLPPGIPAECWWSESWPWVAMTEYPNGDRNMNTLPTMEGREYMALGEAAALKECHRRVLAYWHHMQTAYPEFQSCRISWIAPVLGVRESRRVVARYTLRQQDLLTCVSRSPHKDIICIGDHEMDTHGRDAVHAAVAEPYGVPYRCLLPEGLLNVLVACRGAGFSSIAASGFRLSRNMMQLGQAAATAAAIAKDKAVDLPSVPAEALRESLRRQHVQLEFPMTEELKKYLENE